MTRFLVASLLFATSLRAADADLRLELVRESLTGTHYRYRQYINGLPVAGGTVTITRDASGEVIAENRELAATGSGDGASVIPIDATHVVNRDGVARFARRVVVEAEPLRPIAYYIDVLTGEILRIEPLYFNAKPARVFEVNPVARLNAPSLRDANDAASAVPPDAYSDVELQGVANSGPLAGPHATIVDLENPAIPPVELSRSLIFDRQDDAFEDVNAYFHVDRTQRYLQSLGYSGTKQLVPYSISIDAHAAGGSDNSFYISTVETGRGNLYFGDGGTDDAEDPDLIVHEYGHAILDWISPLTFTGHYSSQSRALGEGWCDYWTFSDQYEKTVASGRDASCFADWDARCGGDAASERCAYAPNADCLRRIDSPKTMRDYDNDDAPGVEHRNGEIWSAAMRQLFLTLTSRHGLAEGKRITDTIAVEAMFGVPSAPTFADVARRMIVVDRLLFGGTHVDAICAAMSVRGILETCELDVPRADRTLYQSRQQGIPIPDAADGILSTIHVDDARPIRNIWVRVDIDHPVRGDLRIVLIAPDRTEVVLQVAGIERTPGPRVTFGIDAPTVQPLSALRGKIAAGDWQLRVTDFRQRDVGTLLSWGLILQLEGDMQPLGRPSDLWHQTVPVVGHILGANGTRFASDVRVFAPERPANVTLIYTPSHADGANAYAAMRMRVAGGQIVAFDDVVRTLFNTTGMGQLEVASDVPVKVSTRTYTTTPNGTLGESVPAVPFAAAPTPPLLIPILKSDADFRSNLGVAEMNGIRTDVRVELLDGEDGSIVSTTTFALERHSHAQIPVSGRPRMSARITALDDGAEIAAYASIVDNRSGDAIHVPPVTNSGTLAPAVHARGAAGSFWRTDLWAAAGATPASLAFEFLSGTTTVVGNVTPARPNGNIEIRDVVQTLFQQQNVLGAIHRFTGRSSILRIYTDAPGGGTLGQAVPFTSGTGTRAELLHVDNNATFRTNVGVALLAPTRVRFTLLDAAGTSLGTIDRDAPAGVLQIPVSDIVDAPLTNGRVVVELLGPQPPGFTAYGSLVDNRSGDPTFLRAQ